MQGIKQAIIILNKDEFKLLSVNYTPSVLTAQNNLAKSSNAVNKALERMSTGFKINSAKDDAAGMYVCTKLSTQIRGLKQANKNAQDGISFLNTASESLRGMNSILGRIRDLSVQASNGVYDQSAREAMQAEADSLTKELYRLKNSTNFNGKAIFGEAEENLNTITTALYETKAVASSSVPAGYTAIYTAEDLDNVRNNLTGKYILMNDIDLSGISNWVPIGVSTPDETKAFEGVFDGNGYEIQNMKINNSSLNYNGLFSIADGAEIKNLGVTNINISIEKSTGGIVGFARNTTISNCYTSGNIITTRSHTGGGGIVRSTDNSLVTNCYSTCNIKGDSAVGGLIGDASDTQIKNSFATGNINGRINVGGLIGDSMRSTVSNCYAAGNVTGTQTQIGGLIGRSYSDISISNCYSTGKVIGSEQIGGLIGLHSGSFTSVNDCFWDKDKSTQNSSKGGTGKSTAEMANIATFKTYSPDIWNLTIAPPTLKNMPVHKIDPPKPPSMDGALRLQVGANGDDTSVIFVDTLFSLGKFNADFTDEISANASINTIDLLMNKINQKVSDFGAILNRLDSVLSVQTTSIENLCASRSTIQDADIAKESADFVKNRILQQTTAALMTQALQANSSVLVSLIGA